MLWFLTFCRNVILQPRSVGKKDSQESVLRICAINSPALRGTGSVLGTEYLYQKTWGHIQVRLMRPGLKTKPGGKETAVSFLTPSHFAWAASINILPQSELFSLWQVNLLPFFHSFILAVAWPPD